MNDKKLKITEIMEMERNAVYDMLVAYSEKMLTNMFTIESRHEANLFLMINRIKNVCSATKARKRCGKSDNTGPDGLVIEHPLREREVLGSNPGRAIPKALEWLLGAQHYKQALAFLLLPNFAQLTSQHLTK